jgi:hypothetical protein
MFFYQRKVFFGEVAHKILFSANLATGYTIGNMRFTGCLLFFWEEENRCALAVWCHAPSKSGHPARLMESDNSEK